MLPKLKLLWPVRPGLQQDVLRYSEIMLYKRRTSFHVDKL